MFTDWPGHSPQEVEDQVTYPLTANLQGLAGVRVVRSQSAFGFSMIYVVFEDNVDLYFARARVLERMSLVTQVAAGRRGCRRSARTRPASATSSGTPSRAPTHSLRELRSAAGLVRSLSAQRRARRGRKSRRSAATSSSTRSTSIRTGCAPTTFRSARWSRAVRDSNLNVGGNVLECERRVADRARRRADPDRSTIVKQIVVGASNGVPVYVEQVADVHVGNALPGGSRSSSGHERSAWAASSSPARGVNTKAGDRRGQGAHRTDRARPAAGRHASCRSTTGRS